MHNFPLLTMLRGVNVDFLSRSFAPEEGSAAPFTCLRYRADRPSRHVRKEADHHAKYSKNIYIYIYKKNVVSLTYYRFRTTVVICWTTRTRQESARHALTYGIKRFELVHHVLNYVWSSLGIRILCTRTDLVPRRLSTRGNKNVRSSYCEICD